MIINKDTVIIIELNEFKIVQKINVKNLIRDESIILTSVEFLNEFVIGFISSQGTVYVLNYIVGTIYEQKELENKDFCNFELVNANKTFVYCRGLKYYTLEQE